LHDIAHACTSEPFSCPAPLSRPVPLYRLFEDDVNEGTSSSGSLNDPVDVGGHPGDLQLDVLGTPCYAKDPGPGSDDGVAMAGEPEPVPREQDPARLRLLDDPDIVVESRSIAGP